MGGMAVARVAGRTVAVAVALSSPVSASAGLPDAAYTSLMEKPLTVTEQDGSVVAGTLIGMDATSRVFLEPSGALAAVKKSVITATSAGVAAGIVPPPPAPGTTIPAVVYTSMVNREAVVLMRDGTAKLGTIIAATDTSVVLQQSNGEIVNLGKTTVFELRGVPTAASTPAPAPPLVQRLYPVAPAPPAGHRGPLVSFDGYGGRCDETQQLVADTMATAIAEQDINGLTPYVVWDGPTQQGVLTGARVGPPRVVSCPNATSFDFDNAGSRSYRCRVERATGDRPHFVFCAFTDHN